MQVYFINKIVLLVIIIQTYRNRMSEERVEILSHIEDLFPDIEDELQNRHSSMYGKFKLNFMKQFSNQQPEFYVNVKGITKPFSIRHTNFGIYFAVQNGITLVLSKEPKADEVHISFGKDFKLVKLSKIGQLLTEQEDKEYCGLISMAYQIGLRDRPKNKLVGANIYVQNTIVYGSFHFTDATAMAFIVASLLLNGLLQNFSPKQIQNLASEVVGYEVCNYTKFKNYNCCISNIEGDIVKGFPILREEWKFIISDLLLNQDQNNLISSLNIKGYAELRVLEKILCQYFKQQSCDIAQILATSFQTLSEQKIQGLKNFSLVEANDLLKEDLNLPEDTLLQVEKKLKQCIQQYKIIDKLSKSFNRQTLKDALRQSYFLKKNANLIPVRIQELIEICLKNKAIGCTIIQNKHLLILADKTQVYNLFQLVKKEIFLNEDKKQKVEGGIHKYLFSTLPSQGIGVLDPINQMWFDQ